MNNIEKRRLLNVAKASREAPIPDDFTMVRFGTCGTPRCVLGQYAFRADLQRTFMLNDYGVATNVRSAIVIAYNGPAIRIHFGVNSEQAEELFGIEGCGDAQTNIQAASYIERFVARH